MGKITEKLIASLLVLFLLIYVGVQVARYFNKPVKTETVYAYTISQSLTANGIVFREEQVLDAEPVGVQSCLYEDGERVLVGETVVEFLSGAQGNNRAKLRETEWEISMLKEAQNTATSHFSNAEALGRDIRQQISSLVQMSSTGNYVQVQTVRPQLASLLNKRQIATGKESGFEGRISSLESEITALSSAAARDTISMVKAPVSGYYAKPVDGLESELTLELATEGDLDELVTCVENSIFRPASKAGKLVTSQNWYVAVVTDKYDIQGVQTGQTLTLDFDNIVQGVHATVSRVLTENESDRAVLVLHCNYVNADTINLRQSEIKLNFSQINGIRVDTTAIRFQDEQPGVFVLENNTVKFKKLDIIHEEPTFVLSKQPLDPYDSVTLRQFEQIIVKGTELSDGKIID